MSDAGRLKQVPLIPPSNGQKEAKNDVVNEADNTWTTISEDLTDGQSAKLDASLKLLSEDSQKLLLPSDQPDDDEFHIIETVAEGAPGRSNYLDDYCDQLMFHEQQNKKRLLMMREGGEVEPFNEADAAKESKRRYKANAMTEEQNRIAATTQKPFEAPTALRAEHEMSKPSAGLSTVHAAKRQKRSHLLVNAVEQSVNGNKSNVNQ
ncbi:MAG: hypothetical protein Q9214_006154, partial [Letrouitia sp. 1 TL-2023]